MEIKVLGPGCDKCRKLYTETEKALESSGVDANLSKVEKIDEIVNFGVMITPALVIDGEVLVSGKVPPVHEIADMIKKAAG